jgi:hypothetical protein
MFVVAGFTDIPQTGSTADFSDCVDVISKLHFFLFLAFSLIINYSASIKTAVRVLSKNNDESLARKPDWIACDIQLTGAFMMRLSQSGYFLLNMAGFTEKGVNFLTTY